MPKALLYFLKKKLSKDSQYFGGTLKVELYKDKKIKSNIKMDKYSKFLQNN